MASTQNEIRREGLVAAAVADGRLLESSRKAWHARLEQGGVAAEKLLASLVPAADASKLVDESSWFAGSPSRGGAA
jgi:hypothetical protein